MMWLLIIQKAVKSGITVADWDLTVAQSPSLLSDDGIHIKGRQGNELYADLILKSLQAAQPMP
jgi:predicted DsbA family dithiol-disulfide isomerase